jgi:ABC-type multidrug transport system permease subunit
VKLLPYDVISHNSSSSLFSRLSSFGGLFISPSSIPIGWKWFYYLNPTAKAFTSVALSQLYCDSTPTMGADGQLVQSDCPTFVPGPGAPPVYTYDYIAHELESSVDAYPRMVGYLILTIAVFRVLILVTLKNVSHIKR